MSTLLRLAASRFLSLLACLVVAACVHADVSYTITDLGDTTAEAINNTGVVTGTFVNTESGFPVSDVFTWSLGQGRRDFSLPNHVAVCLNDAGDLAGYDQQAFLYSGGTLTELGMLAGDTFSQARGIDRDGAIVGRSGNRAFIYSKVGGIRELGHLSPGGMSDAAAIRNGWIAGSATVNGASGNWHAFRYARGKMQDLGTLGGAASAASGVNMTGQVVGGADTAETDAQGNVISHAFLYSSGKMTDLRTINGYTNSIAKRINSSGQIIGSVMYGASSLEFVWTPKTPNSSDGNMVLLRDLIPAGSGWTLDYVSDINDSGQIVGHGRLNGIPRSFLLTPTNVVDHAQALKIQAVNAAGGTYDVDGIVCDNLPCMRLPGEIQPGSIYCRNSHPGSRNYLVVETLPGYTNSYLTATLSNGYGTTDQDNVNNVGWVDNSKQGFLIYYPPDEFNERQHPTFPLGNDITQPVTRTVYLTVTIKQFDGTVLHVNTQPIILARAPMVFVHGINSKPSDWNDFTTGIRQYMHVPIVAVNHYDPKNYNGVDYTKVGTYTFSGIFGGNGPVEVAASLLADRIQNTLNQVRSGWAISDADQNTGDEVTDNTGGNAYTGTDGKLLRLAIRHVDVVAWSYGGVITRWYIASRRGTTHQSRLWYKRPGGYQLNVDGYGHLDFTLNLPDVAYGGNIRKVITLGSPWRGTPLANYVNEALFNFTGEGIGNAPLIKGYAWQYIENPTINTFVTYVLPYVKLPVHHPTWVPAYEVTAIDSPWLNHLIYPDPPPHKELKAAPFDENIAYGSVAGDNNAYLAGIGDVYTLLYEGQSPSWFPYMGLEREDNAEHNLSDGLIPVWSAAIPGSYKLAPAAHDKYPQDKDTREYVVQWMNSALLPSGGKLNEIWNNAPKAAIRTYDRTYTWTFPDPYAMAPYPQSDLYTQVRGVGRLDPEAWANLPRIGKTTLLASATLVLSGKSNRTSIQLTFTNNGNVLVPDARVVSAQLDGGALFWKRDTVLPLYMGTIRIANPNKPGPVKAVLIEFDGSVMHSPLRPPVAHLHLEVSTPLHENIPYDFDLPLP